MKTETSQRPAPKRIPSKIFRICPDRAVRCLRLKQYENKIRKKILNNNLSNDDHQYNHKKQNVRLLIVTTLLSIKELMIQIKPERKNAYFYMRSVNS